MIALILHGGLKMNIAQLICKCGDIHWKSFNDFEASKFKAGNEVWQWCFGCDDFMLMMVRRVGYVEDKDLRKIFKQTETIVG